MRFFDNLDAGLGANGGAPGFLFFPFPLLVVDTRSPAGPPPVARCPGIDFVRKCAPLHVKGFVSGGTRLNHLAERHVESSVGEPAATSCPHLAAAYKNLYSEDGL
jgi:hypothetical protein